VPKLRSELKKKEKSVSKKRGLSLTCIEKSLSSVSSERCGGTSLEEANKFKTIAYESELKKGENAGGGGEGGTPSGGLGYSEGCCEVRGTRFPKGSRERGFKGGGGQEGKKGG